MFANSLKKKQNPKFGKFSYYFWKFGSVLQLLPRILPRKHCPGIKVKCCPWAVPEPSFKLWSQERPKQHCRRPSSLPIPFYPPFPSLSISLPSHRATAWEPFTVPEGNWLPVILHKVKMHTSNTSSTTNHHLNPPNST